MNKALAADEFGNEALRKTFQLLATTPNACAEATLISAFDSRSAEVASAAVRAILVRKSALGQEAILDRWKSLKPLLIPIFAQFPGRMVETFTKRLASDDRGRALAALEAAVDIAEYDLIPRLLPHLENRRSPLFGDVEKAFSALADSLYEETHGRRSYLRKRDPQLARVRVVQELENSLGRFDQHRNSTILASFLCLAGRENSHVVRLLSLVDGTSAAHQETARLFRTSNSQGILNLLASFLDDPHAPLSALQIAAGRTDAPFIDECLRRIENGDRVCLAQNLQKIAHWQWLGLSSQTWKALYDTEQAAAVTWAMLSGISSDRKFEILTWALEQGRAGARLRAAEALENFAGDTANQLLIKHLGDADGRVRAALLNQLRAKEVPGAVARLVGATNDADPHVRKVVQKHLPEYRFRRYADLFDSMDIDRQRANGQIVKKVDPQWRELVELELKSETRLRKLRGLRMAECMEAGTEIYCSVTPFIKDEDAMARQAAVRVLSQSNTPEALQALRECLMDEQVSVRQAAEEALRSKAEQKNALGQFALPIATTGSFTTSFQGAK